MKILIHLIQKGSISRATKTVKNMIDLQKKHKLLKIADKSPAGRNTVQEYLSDDLASNSEDDKKLNAAEARALGKQKFKVKKKFCFFLFGKSKHVMKHYTTPKVFTPMTFRPFKYDNQANIQHQFNNYQGHVQKKHWEQQRRPGFIQDV